MSFVGRGLAIAGLALIFGGLLLLGIRAGRMACWPGADGCEEAAMENCVEVQLRMGHTLCLPPGLSGGDDRGVDTAVATWSGPGIQILVDEGPFADPLTSYAGRPNYW